MHGTLSFKGILSHFIKRVWRHLVLSNGFPCGKLQFHLMFGPLIAVNIFIQDMECQILRSLTLVILELLPQT